MNIPKKDVQMPQFIIDTCASDSDRTCETCTCSEDQCENDQIITLCLEVHSD